MQRNRQGGFTLIEILITLTIITTMAVVTLGALSPWLDVRQQFETERKLGEIRDALRSYYQANAYAVEQDSLPTFGQFVTSTQTASATCVSQDAAFSSLGFNLSDAGAKAALDGYNNPFCVFVGNPHTKRVDGVDIYYRNIAIVSTGNSATLDPLTKLTPTAGSDSLVLGGDDKGVLISTLDMATVKYQQTAAKLQRITEIYQTYFTARFLQASDRDINRYYFSKPYDVGGSVDSTLGTWQPASTWLSSIGVTPDLGSSAWETTAGITNDIEVANYNESAATPAGVVSVKAPGGGFSGQLPYNALVRARIPGPAAAPQYAVRAALGQY